MLAGIGAGAVLIGGGGVVLGYSAIASMGAAVTPAAIPIASGVVGSVLPICLGVADLLNAAMKPSVNDAVGESLAAEFGFSVPFVENPIKLLSAERDCPPNNK